MEEISERLGYASFEIYIKNNLKEVFNGREWISNTLYGKRLIEYKIAKTYLDDQNRWITGTYYLITYSRISNNRGYEINKYSRASNNRGDGINV